MHSAHDKGSKNRKNVVLEGVDRSGKSTIAGRLSDLHYHVIHCPYRPSYEDMYQHYRELIQQAPYPVVFDRSFIAEAVYGPILRGASRLSSHEFEELLRLLAAKNFAVCYLREQSHILWDRLLQTPHEHNLVLRHFSELVMAYDRCMEMVAAFVPTHTICPTDLSLESILDQFISLIS